MSSFEEFIKKANPQLADIKLEIGGEGNRTQNLPDVILGEGDAKFKQTSPFHGGGIYSEQGQKKQKRAEAKATGQAMVKALQDKLLQARENYQEELWPIIENVAEQFAYIVKPTAQGAELTLGNSSNYKILNEDLTLNTKKLFEAASQAGLINKNAKASHSVEFMEL